jgi:hypothetical protein
LAEGRVDRVGGSFELGKLHYRVQRVEEPLCTFQNSAGESAGLLGVFDSGDPKGQEKRVKYRDLARDAVMLPDVADLTDVLADLKAEGHDFTREQVTRLSPYMTTHLKRFGQYVLDMDGQLPPLEPKSLDLVDEASPLR